MVRALDREAIASVRRTTGLMFVSNIAWLLPVALGLVPYLIGRGPQPDLNEFVVGAFIAWSFQLLVINGAFLSSTTQSLFAAAVQPLLTLVLASTFIIHWGWAFVYSSVLGLTVLATTLVFLSKFKTYKTEGAGISSLSTFQSFLKTWVTQNPKDLEGYFTSYSHDEPVVTKMVLMSSSQKAALVLPGVHPGPFFPVGSYNLSELVYHELRKTGLVPMVLHGVGGHERNIPTNELTKKYAATIAEAAAKPDGTTVRGIRGPSKFDLGKTSVTAMGFGDEVVTFLSSAPYNTDDLDPKLVDEAVAVSDKAGADLLLVDAHNSIGGDDLPVSITEEDWGIVFAGTMTSPQEPFQLGVAHSSEIEFKHGSDISDGGLAVLVIQKNSAKYALVTADSNNAILGLRQRVIEELRADGVGLIELCTSDTHKSAARSLTDRGYHALGEDTDREALLSAIKKLEKLAESRLSTGSATTVTSKTTLPLIGGRSLQDFATLTKETLAFTKTYALAACAWGIVVFALALFA